MAHKTADEVPTHKNICGKGLSNIIGVVVRDI